MVITKRTELDWFHLDGLRFALELDYQHRDNELGMSGGPTNRETEDRTREILEMSGGGFFGHPNIAAFRFQLRLAVEQDDLDSDRATDRHTDRFVNEFDVSSLLFRKTSIPVRVYGRRDQSTIDQTFGGSIDSSITEIGTQVRFLDGFAPNTFTYFHRIQDYNGTQVNNNYEIVQDTVQSEGSLTGILPGQFNWDYTFDRSSEMGQRTAFNNFQRHNLGLNHRLRFGENDRNHLRSLLQYRRESGNRDAEWLQISEQLSMNFTQKFDATLDYSFSDRDSGGSRQRQHQGGVRFTHRLFDSLVTSGSVRAQNLSIPAENFESDRYTGALRLSYTKVVPSGQLHATVDLNHSRQDSSEMGAPIQIIDEGRSFDPSDRIVIQHRNIDTTSVVITDVTGLFVYVEGLDYTFNPLADRLEVRRILIGNITAGQTVLIDYVIGPEPGGRLTTSSQNYSIRYALNDGPLRGVSFYVRFRTTDESRPAVNGITLPQADMDNLIVGAEFARDQLTLTGEWQHVDSISPFERFTVSGAYTWPLGTGGRVGVDATYSQLNNAENNNTTRLTFLTANWNHRFGQRWGINYRFRWRNEDDSIGLDSSGFDHGLDATWQYRQTTITAELRSSMLQTNSSDNDLISFGINFRREF